MSAGLTILFCIEMSAAHLARQTTAEAEDTVIRAVIQVTAEAADHFKLSKQHLKRRYFVKKFLRFFYLSEKGTLLVKCSFYNQISGRLLVLYLYRKGGFCSAQMQLEFHRLI